MALEKNNLFASQNSPGDCITIMAAVTTTLFASSPAIVHHPGCHPPMKGITESSCACFSAAHMKRENNKTERLRSRDGAPLGDQVAMRILSNDLADD